jgi:hypothetical protein
VCYLVPNRSRHDPPSSKPAPGCEPEFTSSHLKFHGSCDFIWFSQELLGGRRQQQQQQSASPLSSSSIDDAGSPAPPRLRPVSVLLPPDSSGLPRGLPTQHYGSDHVCLMSVFEFTREEDGPCVVADSTDEADSATADAAATAEVPA